MQYSKQIEMGFHVLHDNSFGFGFLFIFLYKYFEIEKLKFEMV